MKHNPVGWFEIYVEDLERAKNFYESVFQLKLEKLNSSNPEIWAFPMDLNHWGAGGALVKMEGVSSGRNSTLVYFSCEDCSIEESRVAKFGGRIQRNKMSIGQYGFISLVFDTEGNMFGLHSMQ
jgi:predicted enzyme related to lactoylglutathione lyase